MSSPKDTKTSLPLVTKTEGVYALAVAPATRHPQHHSQHHPPTPTVHLRPRHRRFDLVALLEHD